MGDGIDASIPDPTAVVIRLLLERKATPIECATMMMRVSGIEGAYGGNGATLAKATRALARKYDARIGALDAIKLCEDIGGSTHVDDLRLVIRAARDALMKLEAATCESYSIARRSVEQVISYRM